MVLVKLKFGPNSFRKLTAGPSVMLEAMDRILPELSKTLSCLLLTLTIVQIQDNPCTQKNQSPTDLSPLKATQNRPLPPDSAYIAGPGGSGSVNRPRVPAATSLSPGALGSRDDTTCREVGLFAMQGTTHRWRGACTWRMTCPCKNTIQMPSPGSILPD